MNNHTTTLLIVAASLVMSLFVNISVAQTSVNSRSQIHTHQPSKYGFIKVSDEGNGPSWVQTYSETFLTAEPATEEPVATTVEAEKVEESVSFKSKLNKAITANLKKVYDIAKNIGHPETMQAILMQESGGGVANPVGNLKSPVGKRSYGIMQVQVVAARSILTRYPETFERYFPDRKYSSVSDEEIIALLIRNDEANIRIATQHFGLYLSLSNGDWNKAVAAYNMGIGNANKRSDHANVSYVKEIKARMIKLVKPFNKNNGIAL